MGLGFFFGAVGVGEEGGAADEEEVPADAEGDEGEPEVPDGVAEEVGADAEQGEGGAGEEDGHEAEALDQGAGEE